MMADMGRHRSAAATRFRILFVCTGNVCRSPLAATLAQQLLGDRAFEVRSAGTHAAVGSPMHPETCRQLAPWITDVAIFERFTAQQLRPATVEHSDLVLTATRRHRSVVVTHTPRAMAWTFTLREFARLATVAGWPNPMVSDPVDHAAAVVERVRRSRSRSPGQVLDDDIADPIGHPRPVHEATGSVIADSVMAVVAAIAPTPLRP